MTFLFAGCGGDTKPAKVSRSIYTFEKTVTPVFMNIDFGKIDLNSNENYVSEGKRSIKLTPKTTNKDSLYAYFPLRSDVLAFNYADLSNYSEITAKIYSEGEYTVGLGLYFSSLADSRAEKTVYNLKQGWNEIKYEIAHSLISIQHDFTDCWGIYFIADTQAVAQNHSFYVDDIRIVESSQAPDTTSSIYLVSTNDYFELADFEHAYQRMVITANNSYGTAPLPLVEVVKASDFGVTAPSGERILRVVSYPRYSADGNASTWTQLFFSDMLIKAFDTSRFSNTEEFVFKFNLYQAGDVPVGHPYGLEINAYHTKNTSMDWGAIIGVKDEWVEYSMPLSNYQNFINDPSRLALSSFDWNSSDHGGATQTEYYLDNFRIERVAK